MPGIPESSRRGKGTLIVCVILFGAICFLAGRFTFQPAAPRTVPGAVDNSVHSPADANESAGKSAVVAGAESPPQTNRSASSSGWDEKQWQLAISRPGSPARSAVLAELLERLAAADPDRAMSLAKAEVNLKLRETLVQASLRGWARTAATNAANWALALSDSNERERALTTVFSGAVASSPDEAVRLGKSLFQKYPDDAASYGAGLIGALCDAGNFEIAARMAADGDAATRSGWMGGAYSRWAEFQPDQAARAAAAIKDPDLRNEALHGIVGGWSEADPATLIQFVTQLPADSDRGALLSQSLQRWVKHDPEAASSWINNRDPGPDLDEGVAAVASMDSIPPDTAIGWAESVVNPKLRSETLVTVIRNWLTADLPAARRYFDTTKNLLPEDRQELTEVFAVFKNDAPRQ